MRCFTALGPAGSGKTTLINRLAQFEESSGRLESRGGFSVVTFQFMGEAWTAIDCPGDIESLPDARAALLASDAAVVVVPPDPDAAVLAAPFLRAVEASGAPCLLFVNRVDEIRGRMRDIAAALQDYCSEPIVLRQVPMREDGRIVGAVDLVSERAWRYREGEPSRLVEVPQDVTAREQEARAELLEHLSEFDDWLLEEIVEDRAPATAAIYAICSRLLAEGRAVPALMGSALHGAGLMRLMKALRHEAPPVDALRQRLASAAKLAESELLAATFHADHRKHIGKATYLRALGDGVAAGGTLGGASLGAATEVGTAKPAQNPLPPGNIAVALKSDHLAAARLVLADRSVDPRAAMGFAPPMFVRRLVPESENQQAKLSQALARLAEEDPGLTVGQEEATGALLVRVQGPMHLRRVLETLSEEFGVRAKDGVPDEIWCETISRPASVHYRHRKQTGGAGQFADVKLTVRPNPRGTGFSFGETIKGGSVPRNYIPAVEAGARDALAAGPLGFPVADIGVTLTDGQYHAVDSSDFAFRAAGRAAVAQALAEGAPILLQPIHEVAIYALSIHSGALVATVSSLKGRVLGFDRDPDARGWDVFRAQLPGGSLEDLAQALRAATQGVAWFESSFDHFEEVYGRDADRVVQMRRGGR